MVVRIVQTAVLLSGLFLFTSSAKSQEPGVPGDSVPLPMEIAPGNLVDATATNPQVGTFKISWTLTPAAGWTADGAVVTVKDAAGNIVYGPTVQMVGTVSVAIPNLPAGTYTATVEGLFRKGNMADRPIKSAAVTVR